jgi:hypothetical protein
MLLNYQMYSAAIVLQCNTIVISLISNPVFFISGNWPAAKSLFTAGERGWKQQDSAGRRWNQGLLDFGKGFSRRAKFFEEYLKPRSANGLVDFIEMGLIPDVEGIYRDDLLEMAGRKAGSPTVDAVLVSHAHADHVVTIFRSCTGTSRYRW